MAAGNSCFLKGIGAFYATGALAESQSVLVAKDRGCGSEGLVVSPGRFCLHGDRSTDIHIFMTVKALSGPGLIWINRSLIFIFTGKICIKVATLRFLGFLEITAVQGAVESSVTGGGTFGLGTVGTVAVKTLYIMTAVACIGNSFVFTVNHIEATAIVNSIAVG